ncbi:sensor histidine kinase [Micromonospora sp. NBC_01796]|uniref:sensor histidine kinase n=1 Tax=Micromonospora sp. NBC_01796 TaxID=2975987 RepID=UPI002DD966E8|nr:sensor domain-containing protein [Micromonospora sp. NBC_01796]WSA85934.1 sensor domain-containing protein [Micromonospora sp. NBC_01796]
MTKSIDRMAGRWELLGWAFMMAGLAVAELLLLTWVLTTLTLAAVWIGLPLFVSAVLALRRFADRRRLWAGEKMGVVIGRLYRPVPERGWVMRFQAVAKDPATWRDIRWLFVDCTAGLALCLVPVALFLAGVLGLALPLIWSQLPADAALDFPLGLRVTDVSSALTIAVPNGILYLVGWWWLTPALMRWYARLVELCLRPDERSRLSDRVERLASSRAHSVDHQAAELRRIERDLHDGTQAHLVALGMNLGLAETMLTDDPKVQSLLAEARAHNSQAITELRALVRGIRPPVLSDRGLVGALQALAIRIPMEVEVDIELPARPPEPIESAVYFAVAEALTNAIKHSGATHAWVRGTFVNGTLSFLVGDNGRGGAAPTTGGGLEGIERRLGVFDGTTAVASPPGGGTTIRFDIPCELNTSNPA